MNDVKIYTVNRCMFCEQAKRLMDNLDLGYTEIKSAFGSPDLEEIIQKTGHMTAPMIFINETFVGGYTDLGKLVRTGAIKELLHEE